MLKINIAWNPRLKVKFLKNSVLGFEPGTLKITNGGHPSKYWLGSTLLDISDRTLKLSSIEPSQYLDGWPPVVIFRVPGSNPGMEKLLLLLGFQAIFDFQWTWENNWFDLFLIWRELGMGFSHPEWRSREWGNSFSLWLLSHECGNFPIPSSLQMRYNIPMLKGKLHPKEWRKNVS